jgi:hypothetical protein
MTSVWTWGGTYFGRLDGDNLWTHDGKHIGKLRGEEVFGQDGRYLGEIKTIRLQHSGYDSFLRVNWRDSIYTEELLTPRWIAQGIRSNYLPSGSC